MPKQNSRSSSSGLFSVGKAAGALIGAVGGGAAAFFTYTALSDPSDETGVKALAGCAAAGVFMLCATASSCVGNKIQQYCSSSDQSNEVVTNMDDLRLDVLAFGGSSGV